MEERLVGVEDRMENSMLLPIRIAFDERINDALGVKKAIEKPNAILSEPESFLSN